MITVETLRAILGLPERARDPWSAAAGFDPIVAVPQFTAEQVAREPIHIRLFEVGADRDGIDRLDMTGNGHGASVTLPPEAKAAGYCSIDPTTGALSVVVDGRTTYQGQPDPEVAAMFTKRAPETSLGYARRPPTDDDWFGLSTEPDQMQQVAAWTSERWTWKMSPPTIGRPSRRNRK